jgi:hypothetical protein
MHPKSADELGRISGLPSRSRGTSSSGRSEGRRLGDWWDDGYRRDYWRCESAFGDFVLYLDRMDDQWWVQGWFD